MHYAVVAFICVHFTCTTSLGYRMAGHIVNVKVLFDMCETLVVFVLDIVKSYNHLFTLT